MAPSGEKLAARPRVRLSRPLLDDGTVQRIRRERLAPQRTQWDYLHLEGLRRGLADAFDRVARRGGRGPVLDLFCGAKPYAPLVPWEPVVGLDIDRHFGGADVVGDLPLPFADGTFGVAVCTQALHMVDDPVATVAEIGRVVSDGGHVVVTIPHLFLAEGDFERHLTKGELVGLFRDWDDVAVRGVDGPGAALAFVLGRIAMLAARRWRAAQAVFLPTVLVLNSAGRWLDLAAGPVRRRWPHSLVLVARRRKRG
jgi:SAM-dependent methyltransferase